jgi:hypothetical protein
MVVGAVLCYQCGRHDLVEVNVVDVVVALVAIINPQQSV